MNDAVVAEIARRVIAQWDSEDSSYTAWEDGVCRLMAELREAVKDEAE